MTNKRKMRALILVLSLLFSVFVGTLIMQNEAKTTFVQAQTSNNNTVTDRNPYSTISIQSPENKTYNSNNVTVQFTIGTTISRLKRQLPKHIINLLVALIYPKLILAGFGTFGAKITIMWIILFM